MIWVFVVKSAAFLFATRDCLRARWGIGLGAILIVLAINVGAILFLNGAEELMEGMRRAWAFALASSVLSLVACRLAFRAASRGRDDLDRQQALERTGFGFLALGLLDLALGLVIAGATVVATDGPF